MHKDLKKLIVETINQTFAKAPEKLVERGTREIYYDICPHCKQEIHEKHDFSEDGGASWRHSDCGGLILRPETPLEEVVDWLHPYAQEALRVRQEARERLGLAPLPDNEPGGTMAAVNTVSIANEENRLKPQPINPYDKDDTESGKSPIPPDNDPFSKNYDPKRPTIILHPRPKSVPLYGMNENKRKKK